MKNICCLLLSRIVYTECVIPSCITLGSLFVVWFGKWLNQGLKPDRHFARPSSSSQDHMTHQQHWSNYVSRLTSCTTKQCAVHIALSKSPVMWHLFFAKLQRPATVLNCLLDFYRNSFDHNNANLRRCCWAPLNWQHQSQVGEVFSLWMWLHRTFKALFSICRDGASSSVSLPPTLSGQLNREFSCAHVRISGRPPHVPAWLIRP